MGSHSVYTVLHSCGELHGGVVVTQV